MFDFLFGGKRKLELIRELLEQRMRAEGFDDMESRLKIKQLGNLQLIGTPEGTLVTILETVISLQKKGVLIGQILSSIEDHRKGVSGQDPTEVERITNLCRSSVDDAIQAIAEYAFYRVRIEHQGRMDASQFEAAFLQAVKAMAS